MDGLLTSIVGAAPQLGVTGLLLAVVVLLVRREVQTSELHGIEMERQARIHDEEIAERDEEIAALRTRCDRLQERLDDEMERRRAAQDTGRHRLD
ncbi:hypothetical protein Psed_5811 [Pseudonocardia dioxanivorans CB1190]|uniref:Uncharacterized protein n=1 Tax=Pseudonocardia dioxanivorans (strain ATCC 55486 / DSM 44775 / JCM 13855 / CB1190) TaxID=675635 RepID=F4D1E8_PSEUX|nr:hypothetical protein [Pseudonocardia dioxanivorans]AEA27936.1 hypothetical protein Psed_5811 [Pseudonocardia dioxanivorans CB1190]